MHLTEVREAESRMAFFFLKTVTLTGRARRAPPEDRSSERAGILDYRKLSCGDLRGLTTNKSRLVFSSWAEFHRVSRVNRGFHRQNPEFQLLPPSFALYPGVHTETPGFTLKPGSFSSSRR